MKDYTILENFLKVQSNVPHWYDQAIHRRVCELMKDNKLVTCKFLVDKSKQYNTIDTYGLQWAKFAIADRLQYHLAEPPNLEEQRDKMREILQRILHIFPKSKSTLTQGEQYFVANSVFEELSEMLPEIEECIK